MEIFLYFKQKLHFYAQLEDFPERKRQSLCHFHDVVSSKTKCTLLVKFCCQTIGNLVD